MAVYSMLGYGKMIVDQVRMDAYLRALTQLITPETVVLDIGTGTGIIALLACGFGARKVYAVEPSIAIYIAEELAEANGYANRIQFIQDLSTHITLPERVDVIVSDLRGVLPLFQQHIPSIVDARQRFLRPGGAMIPASDTLWAALVEAPALYHDYTAAWENNSYNLDLRPARRLAINTWGKAYVKGDQLLTDPQHWATMDYMTIEQPDMHGALSWVMMRAGTAHGIIVWFDAVLAAGAGFSNAPGKPEIIYGQAFFPWESPVSLQPGNRVSVSLQAELAGDDYIWSWDTDIYEDNASQPKLSFRQSILLGAPRSPAQRRSRAAASRPTLDGDDLIDQVILGMMDNENSREEIARLVCAAFPARFGSPGDALAHVTNLYEKYRA